MTDIIAAISSIGIFKVIGAVLIVFLFIYAVTKNSSGGGGNSGNTPTPPTPPSEG